MPDEYDVYGDRPRSTPPRRTPSGQKAKRATTCPNCGGARFEDGSVEATSNSTVRYFAAEREEGWLGVRRFGIPQHPVIARRCLDCSRLDLFAAGVSG